MSFWTTTISCSRPPERRRAASPGASHVGRAWLVGTALTLTACLGTTVWARPPGELTQGEALYRRGLLPSGEPLRGTREAGAALLGADAACTSCHRRSGLGSVEGKITIPPIAGPYLFAARGTSLEHLGVPFVDTVRINHTPYDDASLARAIREGISADGRRLNYLMPRYPLDDATMAQLVAYLKSLPVTAAPGVMPGVLHFATIITSDADPVKRRGVLDVMRQYFLDKNNAMARTKAPTLYSSHTTMFRVERRWQLHVWELKGAPATWEAQLEKYLAAEPVFAVISGLGGAHWEPVQKFCERAGLPCLFPNVEAPTGHDSDFYTVYFSRGVLLEAQLIARELADTGTRPRQIVQVYRPGDVGEAAARAVQATQADTGVAIVNRPIAAHPAAELAKAVREVRSDDVLVLWLRSDDLTLLDHVAAPAGSVWVSGEMGGLEHAPLPPEWRTAARVTYPVDLPGQRAVRVDYALSWFRLRRIAVVDQKVQADTYLACGLVSETINHIVDAFVRDYLIERVEMALDHRVLTGYYPRLTLAPGQRFASKGGYIVRFTDAHGSHVAPVGEWTTP